MVKESLLIIFIWLLTLFVIIGIVKVSEADADADIGVASYYSYEMGGRKTANGEMFNPAELTAAHRTLPFGTRVKVTNLKNGKYVVVRINDRGPYIPGRAIDLSYAAAEEIDMVKSGIAEVEIKALT